MITLLTIIYVLSVIGCYWYIHKAYSKGGVWEYSMINMADFFAVILPIVNTILFIGAILFSGYPVEKYNSTVILKKFFRIK